MILSILFTYLIVMCWWCYSWIRENIWFTIRSFREFFMVFFIVCSFIFIFIFFLRLLNIFRERKTIDLYKINLELNINNLIFITLMLILIYSFRRLLVYFFKVMWFRLHYFLLSPHNLPKFYSFYNKFHLNFIYNPFVKMYKFLRITNNFLTLGLIFFLFKDIIYNYGLLDQSLVYIRYYSILKLMYLLSKFMLEKQILILDFYNYNIYYGGACDEEPFHTIMCKKHRNLIGEAMDYKRGVIMESINFLPKKIDYTDNGYYRYINNKNVGIPVTVIKINSLEQLDEFLRKK